MVKGLNKRQNKNKGKKIGETSPEKGNTTQLEIPSDVSEGEGREQMEELGNNEKNTEIMGILNEINTRIEKMEKNGDIMVKMRVLEDKFDDLGKSFAV